MNRQEAYEKFISAPENIDVCAFQGGWEAAMVEMFKYYSPNCGYLPCPSHPHRNYGRCLIENCPGLKGVYK